MGLIPADPGGSGARDALASACHFCTRPAAGPCAWCRLPICGRSGCSKVIEERGIPPVVLCRDCASARPSAVRRPWLPAALAAAGIALLIVPAAARAAPLLEGIGLVAGAGLLLWAVAALWSRWQWRRRLARARPPSKS